MAGLGNLSRNLLSHLHYLHIPSASPPPFFEQLPGNALLLKGGKEAQRSNAALVTAMSAALRDVGLRGPKRWDECR